MAENEQKTKNIKVTGAIVFLELDDGAIRPVQLKNIENMRTIINVCQLDGGGKIHLGDKDFSEYISPHLTKEELDDEDGNENTDS